MRLLTWVVKILGEIVEGIPRQDPTHKAQMSGRCSTPYQFYST